MNPFNLLERIAGGGETESCSVLYTESYLSIYFLIYSQKDLVQVITSIEKMDWHLSAGFGINKTYNQYFS